MKRCLGPEHPDTASSLNNLGVLLQTPRGTTGGGQALLERALAICEKVWGREHPDTARSLNNLGTLPKPKANLAGARPRRRRALHIFRLRLGQDHP